MSPSVRAVLRKQYGRESCTRILGTKYNYVAGHVLSTVTRTTVLVTSTTVPVYVHMSGVSGPPVQSKNRFPVLFDREIGVRSRSVRNPT